MKFIHCVYIAHSGKITSIWEQFKKKKTCYVIWSEGIPIWPINAVSAREAIGSAVRAKAAGNAICAISNPSSSNLRTCLLII